MERLRASPGFSCPSFNQFELMRKIAELVDRLSGIRYADLVKGLQKSYDADDIEDTIYAMTIEGIIDVWHNQDSGGGFFCYPKKRLHLMMRKIEQCEAAQND